MKLLALSTFLAASTVSGYAVVGTPEGFARGTTGGGSAACQVPSSTAQLKSWLEDSTARCIVLDKEFNFIGTEGTKTETGCRPSSNTCPGKGGQDAINANEWCTNGDAGTGVKSVSVTYDVAGRNAIEVNSNKSLIGVGKKGVLKGKGLRLANGVKNVIIQNIHITQLNPQYIWGGDAIQLAKADGVWIDHVKISLVGRQMFSASNPGANRATISYSEFDGNTSWSASCDGRHYWAIYFNGANDQVTLKGNYIHHTSGRSPKIGAKTLLHAVNNYFYDNTGHAFDISSSTGASVVAEGNVFQNVVVPLKENKGSLFTAPSTSLNAGCKTPLGHSCQVNVLTSSGGFSASNTAAYTAFSGKNVASVNTANVNIMSNAGVGIVA